MSTEANSLAIKERTLNSNATSSKANLLDSSLEEVGGLDLKMRERTKVLNKLSSNKDIAEYDIESVSSIQ